MTQQRPPAPKYVVMTPDSEVLGMALLSLEQSSELEEFADLLDKYGLRGIQPDRYYKMTTLMAHTKELMQRPNAGPNLVSIGIKIFKNMMLPEGITTIEQGLQLMNQFTLMNMRNDPSAANWYEIVSINEGHVRCIDRTPWPHDLIYGYMHGIAYRLAPEGARPIVKRTYLNEADPDADGAIYDITW